MFSFPRISKYIGAKLLAPTVTGGITPEASPRADAIKKEKKKGNQHYERQYLPVIYLIRG